MKRFVNAKIKWGIFLIVSALVCLVAFACTLCWILLIVFTILALSGALCYFLGVVQGFCSFMKSFYEYFSFSP